MGPREDVVRHLSKAPYSGRLRPVGLDQLVLLTGLADRLLKHVLELGDLSLERHELLHPRLAVLLLKLLLEFVVDAHALVVRLLLAADAAHVELEEDIVADDLADVLQDEDEGEAPREGHRGELEADNLDVEVEVRLVLLLLELEVLEGPVHRVEGRDHGREGGSAQDDRRWRALEEEATGARGEDGPPIGERDLQVHDGNHLAVRERRAEAERADPRVWVLGVECQAEEQ